MGTPNKSARQPSLALKVPTYLIAVPIGYFVSIFCARFCEWLGMRDNVVFFAQIICLGSVVWAIKSAVFAIFCDSPPSESKSPADSKASHAPSPISTPTVADRSRVEGAPSARRDAPNADASSSEDQLTRIGRTIYIVTTFIPPIVFQIISMVVSWILFDEAHRERSFSMVMLTLLAMWAPFWIYFCILRFHDLDRSGWWAVTIFVPLVQFVAIFLLCFWPGTPGPNRFGKKLEDLCEFPVEDKKAAVA